MEPTHGRVIDVTSLEHFDELVAAGATSMRGWRLQDIDLSYRKTQLRELQVQGALFLGCNLSRDDQRSLRDRGAIVFSDVPDLPFKPYRASLYTPADLVEGIEDGYEACFDARVFAWAGEAEPDAAHAMAAAMHDHSIDTALKSWASERTVVGIMGGHKARRDSAEYRDAAHLAHRLTLAGRTVATGGGPGIMEAANLGARAAGVPAAELDRHLDALAEVPTFPGRYLEWIESAQAVAAQLPQGPETLGVPTWFYGHEPPNMFATAVAKYFQNSVREDTLLKIATGGVIVTPGGAGTVQEIFQDACENNYADEGGWAPLVLFGREFWTETLPAWPLLQALMRGRPGEAGIALVDSIDEAVEFVTAFTPLPAAE